VAEKLPAVPRIRPAGTADDRELACGFEVEGVMRAEFRLEGAWVDDVLMARRLDAP